MWGGLRCLLLLLIFFQFFFMKCLRSKKKENTADTTTNTAFAKPLMEPRSSVSDVGLRFNPIEAILRPVLLLLFHALPRGKGCLLRNVTEGTFIGTSESRYGLTTSILALPFFFVTKEEAFAKFHGVTCSKRLLYAARTSQVTLSDTRVGSGTP